MDRTLIERYAAGADVPAQAIAGLDKAELVAFPVPGTWSIQQIIIHLMESDLIASARMKQIVAEDLPTLVWCDETAASQHLFHEHLSAPLAAEIFRLNRQITADILRRLPDEAFQRKGMHTKDGEKTVEKYVRGYGDHVEHHMKFIREKRKLLGKPL